MYILSDKQIDFILSDIGARGIEMVSLQQDLLDHICCVIEHELDDDGDFERFYHSVIPRFYQSQLKEIEEETVNLLTNKQYYTMKKVMITSGAVSVGILSVGIFLKFMHLPGAAALILVGIAILSFVFLPLMFTLRIKERQEKSDKAIAVIGALSAMLISLGILFKIMHWPGANIMCMSALLLMMVIFIPIYFFTGIRNPVTKTNTVVSSILMFTGCILILTLVRAPHGTKREHIAITDAFLRTEQIVKTEKSFASTNHPQSEDIYNKCEALKMFLLEKETGTKKIDANFEENETFLGDTWADVYLSDAPAQQNLDELKDLIVAYNKKATENGIRPIPLKATIFETDNRVSNALNDLMQVQMVVLQNQRSLVAMK